MLSDYLASLTLGILACSIVFISCKLSSTPKQDEEEEGVTSQDAYLFPLYGSLTLFAIYLIFKHVNPLYIKYVVNVYFGLAGLVSINKLLDIAVDLLKIENKYTRNKYSLNLTNNDKSILNKQINTLQIIMLLPTSLLVLYYVYSKNWLVSNLLGISFCVNGIKMLKLDNYKTGIILLSGLFLYDIFWVFGTRVMVSVATNLDAPIKLLIPKNPLQMLAMGEKAKFTLLGLGDIVIPGAFVNMCLEFDKYKHKINNSNMEPSIVYFNVCFVAYCMGLFVTMVVMHTFKAAQPALLYLSPMCVLSVLLTAVMKNDIKLMFMYESEQAKKERLLKNKGQDESSSSGESDSEIKKPNNSKVNKRTNKKKQ